MILFVCYISFKNYCVEQQWISLACFYILTQIYLKHNIVIKEHIVMLSIIIIVIFMFSSFILRYFDRVGHKAISNDEIQINEDNMATWNIFEEI